MYRLGLIDCEATVVFTGFISTLWSTGSDFVVSRMNFSLSKFVFALRKILPSYDDICKPTLKLLQSFCILSFPDAVGILDFF
jgi:hypothetical protein